MKLDNCYYLEYSKYRDESDLENINQKKVR